MRRRLVWLFGTMLMLATPAAALADSRPAPVEIEHGTTRATASNAHGESSFAEREQQSKKLEKFEGGQTVVIVTSVTTILLVVIILLLVL